MIHGTPEFIKTVVQCVYLDLNFEQLGCKKVLQNFTDVLDGTHRMTILRAATQWKALTAAASSSFTSNTVYSFVI